jgi:hypothetical protein
LAAVTGCGRKTIIRTLITKLNSDNALRRGFRDGFQEGRSSKKYDGKFESFPWRLKSPLPHPEGEAARGRTKIHEEIARTPAADR